MTHAALFGGRAIVFELQLVHSHWPAAAAALIDAVALGEAVQGGLGLGGDSSRSPIGEAHRRLIL